MPVAHVALPLPVRQTFAYRIPDALAARVRPGAQVQVPFRGRPRRGIVVSIGDHPPEVHDVRDVTAVLEDASLSPHLLALGRWISAYYLAPIGEVLVAGLPGGYEGFANSRARRGAIEDRELQLPLAERVTLTGGQIDSMTAVDEAIARGGFAPILLHGVTASGKTEIYLRAAQAVRAQGRQTLVLVPEIALSSQVVAEFRRRFGSRVGLLHSSLGVGERRRNWELANRGALDAVVGARSAVFAPLPKLGLIVVDEEHEPAYKQSERLRYHGRDVAVRRAQMLGIPIVLGSATPSLESLANAARGKYRHVRLAERVDGRSLPQVRVIDLRREASGAGLLTPTLRAAIGERLARREQTMLFLNRRGHSHHSQCRGCGYVPACPHCDIALTLHLNPRSWRCHYCDHAEPASAQCPKCRAELFRYSGSGTQRAEREIHAAFPEARIVRLDTDVTRDRAGATEVVAAFRRGDADILVGTQMIAKGFDFPNVTLVGVLDADVGLHLPDFRSAERTYQLLVQVSGRAGRGRTAGEVYVQTCTPEHPAIAAAVLHDERMFLDHELRQRREARYPPFVRLAALTFAGKEEQAVEAAATEVAAFLRSAAESLGVAQAPVRGEHGTQAEHVRATVSATEPATVAISACASANTGMPALPCESPESAALPDVEDDAPILSVLGPAPHAMARLRGQFRWHVMLKGTNTSALRAAASRALEHYEAIAGKRGVRMVIDIDPVDVL